MLGEQSNPNFIHERGSEVTITIQEQDVGSYYK